MTLARAFFLLSFALLFLSLAPVAAQDTVTDDEVNEVAKDLYCPLCENTPLDVCPTQACKDWREEIRIMLAEGRSQGEIEQYFVDRYGVQVLAEPPRSSFHWLIWIIPVLMVGVAAVFFGRYLVQATRTEPVAGQAAAPAPPPPAHDDDYIARIEKEVREQ